MVIQAIGLLDDLDKEINTYSMRIKEWYGWHFPEMQKIVVDNTMYAKTVVELGMIKNAQDVSFWSPSSRSETDGCDCRLIYLTSCQRKWKQSSRQRQCSRWGQRSQMR